MEVRSEVKTIRVDCKCPSCKTGYLRPTGNCFTTNPPMYPHKCTNCEHGENITGKTYPFLDYEQVSIES